jgi:uncharacterized protein (DUF1501 family)
VAEGCTVVGSQVAVRTSLGLRFFDHIILNQAGQMVAVEVKAGNAVRTALQIAKDAEIAARGGVIVGRNAPAALRGTLAAFNTVVRQVR